MEAQNSPEEIQYRKYRNKLIVSGSTVMTFGIWYLLRILLDFALAAAYYQRILEVSDGDTARKWMLFIYLPGLFVIALGFRAYAGKAAIREARGIRKGNLYIFLTFIFLAVSAFDFADDLIAILLGTADSDFQNVAALIVEITSLVASFDLIWSALRMRQFIKIIESKKEREGITVDE